MRGSPSVGASTGRKIVVAHPDDAALPSPGAREMWPLRAPLLLRKIQAAKKRKSPGGQAEAGNKATLA
jgi:hypothetical protein